jgi:hypothetical protein
MIAFASKPRSRLRCWSMIVTIGILALVLAMSSCEAARHAPALAHNGHTNRQGVAW